MRAVLTALILLMPGLLFAQTINVAPMPHHALVTNSGSLVTYRVPVDVPEGQHQIALTLGGVTDAMQMLVPPRFDGTGAVRLVSSQTAPAVPGRVISPELQVALDALALAEAQLQEVQGRVASQEADLLAAEQELVLIDAISNGTFGAASTVWPGSTAALAQTLDLIGTRTTQALARKRQAELGLDRLKREVSDRRRDADDAARRANLLRYDDSQGRRVILDVQVSEPFSGHVTLGLYWQMRWQPRYQLHVAQTGVNAKVRLERHADLVGLPRPGFADLGLTLSTAELLGATQTPVPQSQWRDLFDPSKAPQAPMSRELGAAVLAEAAPVMLDNAGFALRGQTVVYELDARFGAAPNSDSTTVALDTLEFDADLFARANAASDKTAFLFATLQNDSGGVILPGQMLIVRDGVAAGEAYLPEIKPGRDADIGLGPLLGLQLRRDVLTSQRGESGLLTSTSERSERWRTTVTSTLDYGLRLNLLDVLPSSRHEDLQINLVARPRPDVMDREGQKGVLVWHLDMAPGQSREVAFGYDMSWPSEMSLR